VYPAPRGYPYPGADCAGPGIIGLEFFSGDGHRLSVERECCTERFLPDSVFRSRRKHAFSVHNWCRPMLVSRFNLVATAGTTRETSGVQSRTLPGALSGDWDR
jgi:hypothetical protein